MLNVPEQFKQAAGYACMLVRVVETLVLFVAEDVQKPEWLVGKWAAQTDVYVQKAVEAELVFVQHLLHRIVALKLVTGADKTLVDIAD